MRGLDQMPEDVTGVPHRLFQQNLDIYDASEDAVSELGITPQDVKGFLDRIVLKKKDCNGINIYFDNDMDGFASAIFSRDIMISIGFDIRDIKLFPITHLERVHLKPDPCALLLFVDVQPLEFTPLTFCIDHHQVISGNIHENAFIYPPERLDPIYPTACTILTAYMLYVAEGGASDFDGYIQNMEWTKREFVKILFMLGAVSDNTWMLSKHSDKKLLQEWVQQVGVREKDLLVNSMGISLVLGLEDGRLKGLEPILEKGLDSIDTDFLEKTLRGMTKKANNLFIFAREMDYEVRRFIHSEQLQVAESIEKYKSQIQRDEATVENYIKAMPREIRRQTDRTIMLEMLHTVANRDKVKWKQIEFYGKEIQKLEGRITSNGKRLDALKKKRADISIQNIPGICLFISKQGSGQVKGILASLLYYFGWRNIVIEETEHFALWGARGFQQSYLEGELATFTIDKKLLESYTSMEDVSRELPNALRKSVTSKKALNLQKRYVGGIGGRGTIFGGDIKGKVPQLFSSMDERSIDKKVEELVSHGEFGLAIRGLTEGESEVSTSSALRSKFKSTNWITVQVTGGPESGDILELEIGVILAWLGGSNTELELDTGQFIRID